mgnify:CR=1 FL=1
MEAIRLRFADTKLYIADGHHRYETAINYRDWLRSQGVPEGADSDYVMMMLVEMSHPGLVVFPTHRLVRGLPSFDSAKLLAACGKDFTLAGKASREESQAALEEAYASLYPLHKMGKVSDMANAVKFLSSSEAGFITGEIMQVCGGSLI